MLGGGQIEDFGGKRPELRKVSVVRIRDRRFIENMLANGFEQHA